MPAAAFPIRREIVATLALAAPLAGANLAQMAMGLTNSVMVGHLGGAALAAAGLGAGFNFSLVLMCQGVLTAVAPLAAHAVGAGDKPAAGRVAGAGLVLAALLALPVLVLLTVAPRLLLLLGYQPGLVADIAGYLMAVRWGAPAVLFFVVLRSLLSATSRVRAVMLVLLCGIPANAALNWALIFGHGGLPALGIVGSGAAYAIVQWLMLGGLFLYVLLVPPMGVRLHLGGRLAIELGRIVRLGLPISGLFVMETGVFTSSGILMGLWGADALGAHQLAMSVASLTFMVPLGIGQAATVRVAIQLGAGRPAAARDAAFLALLLGAGLMLVPCLVMLEAPRLIAGCYLDLNDPANRAVVEIAARLLGVAALFQVFDGAQVIAAAALRGYRDTAVPMAIAAFGYWGIGFFGSWALAFPLGLGPIGLWYGLALGLAVVALLLTLRLHYRSRGGWRRQPVPAPEALPG